MVVVTTTSWTTMTTKNSPGDRTGSAQISAARTPRVPARSCFAQLASACMPRRAVCASSVSACRVVGPVSGAAGASGHLLAWGPCAERAWREAFDWRRKPVLHELGLHAFADCITTCTAVSFCINRASNLCWFLPVCICFRMSGAGMMAAPRVRFAGLC